MPEPHEWLIIALGFLLVFAIGVLQWWSTARWDRRRVTSTIATGGGHVQSIQWLPWGWLAQQMRAYSVRYVDADGTTHRVKCRTSWLGGVYFAEDMVDETICPDANGGRHFTALASTSDSEKVHRLEKENRALRAELERLSNEKWGALR